MQRFTRQHSLPRLVVSLTMNLKCPTGSTRSGLKFTPAAAVSSKSTIPRSQGQASESRDTCDKYCCCYKAVSSPDQTCAQGLGAEAGRDWRASEGRPRHLAEVSISGEHTGYKVQGHVVQRQRLLQHSDTQRHRPAQYCTYALCRVVHACACTYVTKGTSLEYFCGICATARTIRTI